MSYAVIGRFVNGQIAITDILPSLERTILRLTTNNEEARSSTQMPDATMAHEPGAGRQTG
jgi:hypothetical protein